MEPTVSKLRIPVNTEAVTLPMRHFQSESEKVAERKNSTLSVETITAADVLKVHLMLITTGEMVVKPDQGKIIFIIILDFFQEPIFFSL